MNCERARSLLPEHRYGELPVQERDALDQHLADCAACAEAARELRRVGQLLDLAPAPAVHVDLAALYRGAAQEERGRRRRWSRLAWTMTAAATLLLMALTLRIEWRWHEGQLVIGWGAPPLAAPKSAEAPAVPPELLAELELIKDLVHSIADDVEVRDQHRRDALAVVERRLDLLFTMSDRRWSLTQDQVRALYAAQFGVNHKGAIP